MALSDREKAFEEKYAHDKDLQFRVMARRNKLLGLWAAGKMGLAGDDAAAYAKDVVESDFERAGDEDVFEKVWKDLQAKEAGVSEHQVRREMQDLLTEARSQMMEE